MSDDVITFIIERYTSEAGVRKLKEILFEIISEINLELLNCDVNYSIPVEITKEKVENLYLKERQPILTKIIHKAPSVGIINGLWANAVGKGGIIPIETSFFPCNNLMDLKLTGMQGDVMKESMSIAKTLAWGLTPINRQKTLVKNFDKTKFQGIHIHCPEGAVPKDGPSAGAAITVSIYSLFNKKKIKNDIAITGEINLQGQITAIGGLNIKILGGIKAGIKSFIYPKENTNNFKKFKEENAKENILDNIVFYEVENIKQVLKLVFV